MEMAATVPNMINKKNHTCRRIKREKLQVAKQRVFKKFQGENSRLPKNTTQTDNAILNISPNSKKSVMTECLCPCKFHMLKP